MEPYYYHHMNKLWQDAYYAMKTGLTALESSFYVPLTQARELADLFFLLRLDCPVLFYAVNFRYRSFPDSGRVEMISEYLFEKGKVREQQKAMKARIEKLVRPAEDLTEQEKERYVHDFICRNVRYDKLKKPYSHEIIGPLGQGVGVCEGIAKTVKILCDALGIWCIIAVSEANPEKKIKYRHAWNVVRIGGRFYQLDVTFDNTLGNGEDIRYDYFNLDDRQFFRDHEPVIYETPACSDNSRFYYREKKLSFTKEEEVEKRAVQAAKKGKTLTFHWRGGYLNRESLSRIMDILERAAGQKGKHAAVSLNWKQAVFCVHFSERLPGEAFTLEQANEGEETGEEISNEGTGKSGDSGRGLRTIPPVGGSAGDAIPAGL